jgi:hypothetical protein
MAAAPSPTPAPPAPALITTVANGSNHGKKVDLQAVYQGVIFGLLTFYQPSDMFQMTTGDFTRDQLIGQFQQFVNAAQQTKASNQKWRADIQAERTLEQNVRELRQAVRGIVQARFGKTGAQLLQFGFTLPKPRKKTAESKAVAVVKSQATRKKRQTLGKNQKKDIKGDVSVALTVTSADAGPQPATASPVIASTAPPAPAPVVAPLAVPAVAPVTTPAPHPGGNGQ